VGQYPPECQLIYFTFYIKTTEKHSDLVGQYAPNYPSGADFGEEGLNVKGKKFKDASIFYNTVSEINVDDLKRWLQKSREIQWDYKNLIKRKGVLERL
jgi:hypothetical protein